MKNCPKCGRANPDTSRYCIVCGHPFLDQPAQNPTPQSMMQANAPSQGVPPYRQPNDMNQNPYGSSARMYGSMPPNKPDKKKKTAVLAAGMIAFAVVIGGLVGFLAYEMSKDNPKEEPTAGTVQELVVTEFEKAEKECLDQIEADPTNPEPYKVLYVLYVENDYLDRAEVVALDALEHLNEDDLNDFNDVVDDTDADYGLIETDLGKIKYDIVAELGALDRVPISLEGSAWLIEKNGKFSFINTSGGTISESDGSRAMIIDQSVANEQGKIHACIGDEDLVYIPRANQWPYNDSTDYSYCSGLGMGPIADGYKLKSDGTVRLEANFEGAEPQSEASANPDLLPVVVGEGKSMEEPFWIYLPHSQTLLGPYESDECPYFKEPGITRVQDIFVNLRLPVIGVSNAVPSSPFWVEKDGMFTIYSEDGRKTKDGFDQAEAVDMTSINAFNGKRLSVFDQNLELEYAGVFEQAGTIIDTIAPVKLDGKWYLINLKPGPKEDSQDKETSDQRTSQNEESSEKAPKEPEPKEKIVPIPSEAVSGYGYFPLRGKAWTNFEVQADGKFTFYWQNENEWEIDGQMTWAEESSHLTGQLEAIEGEDGKIRLRIKDMTHDEPLGLIYQKEGGQQVYEVERPEIHIGAEILFYPPGTPWNDIDDHTQEMLLGMMVPEAPTAGQPLPGPVVRFENSDYMLAHWLN